MQGTAQLFNATAHIVAITEYQFTSTTSDCANGQPIQNLHQYSRNSPDAASNENLIVVYSDDGDGTLGNGEPDALLFEGDAFFDGACTASIQWCAIPPGTGTGTNVLNCDTIYWIGTSIELNTRPRATGSGGCGAGDTDTRTRWDIITSFLSPESTWDADADGLGNDTFCNVGYIVEF